MVITDHDLNVNASNKDLRDDIFKEASIMSMIYKYLNSPFLTFYGLYSHEELYVKYDPKLIPSTRGINKYIM